MTLAVDRPTASSLAPAKRSTITHRSTDTLLPGWPLVVALVGMPLWWVLGLTQVIFFVMAIPMAGHLLRSKVVFVPRNSGTWFIFLGWLLAGLITLRVTAPGSLPETGFGSYLTFGYRFAWYLVGTTAMLYVANTRHLLSTERIAGALSLLFLTLVGGGYLGLLVPRLEFASALELLMPGRLAANGFVRELVHAQAAQVQTFLGGEDARPSAPFAYTNVWGLNIALTLPFFVTEWWRRGGNWRIAVVPLSVVAAIPIVFSLNRGLWGAIIVMAVFVAIRVAMAGRIAVLVGLLFVSVLALGAVLVSPAGDLITQRLDTPHSNEGRGNLGALSVASAWEGSPVIGFGSTRDVAGNFNSIAGGATDDCPRCSPPPLGTQGQLWLLIFGSGFGGFLLYVAFFGSTFWRHARDTAPLSIAALCSLVVVFVTMPVYDAVGLGQFIALISVGLLSRNDDLSVRPPLSTILGKVVRNAWIIIACAGLGGIVGASIQIANGTVAEATKSVLVPAADLTGSPDARPLTLDSEALIATSEPVLDAVRLAIGADPDSAVANHISIGAEPNSRILTITYFDRSQSTASTAAETAAAEYLVQRRALIDGASARLRERLDARSAEINAWYLESISVLDDVDAESEERLGDAYAGLRSSAQLVVGQLEADRTSEQAEGRLLAPPVIVQSTDDLVVRVGSGLTIGALVGLIVSHFVDRRRHRMGLRPARHLAPFDLPTVAYVSRDAVSRGRSDEITQATRSAAAYLPLAGIVADPESSAAMTLAHRFESRLDGGNDRGGQGALVVVETTSRYESVIALLRSCERSGIEPVGLLLIG